MESEKKKTKSKNFNEEDDFQLAKSWKSITIDPINGTDQSGTDFWLKIRDHAAESIPYFKERTCDSLRQRFGLISRSVSKFSGIHSSVLRLNQSGKTMDDKFDDALQLYKDEFQMSFKYRACYDILKELPKFAPDIPRKRPVAEEHMTEQEEDANPEDDPLSQPSSSRPVGQKLAKKQKVSHDFEERRIRTLEEIAEAAKVRNQLLEKHSKVLSAANDVNFLNFLTMDTQNLDPTAREIVELKKREYLKTLKELGYDDE